MEEGEELSPTQRVLPGVINASSSHDDGPSCGLCFAVTGRCRDGREAAAITGVAFCDGTRNLPYYVLTLLSVMYFIYQRAYESVRR